MQTPFDAFAVVRSVFESKPLPVVTVRNPAMAPAYSVPNLAPGPRAMIALPLKSIESDAPQILAYLQTLSVDFGRSPFVREASRRVLPNLIGQNDEPRIAQALVDFVRRNVVYVHDPEGGEFVVSPVVMLQDIFSGTAPVGDCDDHVLLLNSMARSLGIETHVVGVKLYTRDRWDHVISSLLIRGQWIDIDPCAKEGWQPNYRERLIP